MSGGNVERLAGLIADARQTLDEEALADARRLVPFMADRAPDLRSEARAVALGFAAGAGTRLAAAADAEAEAAALATLLQREYGLEPALAAEGIRAIARAQGIAVRLGGAGSEWVGASAASGPQKPATSGGFDIKQFLRTPMGQIGAVVAAAIIGYTAFRSDPVPEPPKPAPPPMQGGTPQPPPVQPAQAPPGVQQPMPPPPPQAPPPQPQGPGAVQRPANVPVIAPMQQGREPTRLLYSTSPNNEFHVYRFGMELQSQFIYTTVAVKRAGWESGGAFLAQLSTQGQADSIAELPPFQRVSQQGFTVRRSATQQWEKNNLRMPNICVSFGAASQQDVPFGAGNLVCLFTGPNCGTQIGCGMTP